MKHRPSSFNLAAVAASIALLAAPAAQASITYNPASIVDHGSYVTDTVNHLDWYKFSNVDTTIGMSYDAALAHFAAGGWSGASIAQVQGLQGQFGWVADTPFYGVNENFGLTSAMGALLGDMGTFFIDLGNGVQGDTSLEALTSDLFFANGSPDAQHFVTTSRLRVFVDLHSQKFFQGDFVQGDYAVQAGATIDPFRGVWLSRDADIPPVDVPEPGTLALFGISLFGLLARRRTTV